MIKRRRLRKMRRPARLARLQHAARVAPKAKHPYFPTSKRRVRRLTPPCSLDLESNYADTVGFLRDLRAASETLRGKLLVDFSAIQEISPAAALLLVAECDRWRLRTNMQSLRAVDVQHWSPGVYRCLREMGFFEILRARGRLEAPFSPGEDRYVPFQSGARSPGGPAQDLRRRIEELGPRIADRHSLYDGLVEAMTNVHQHAYREGNPGLHKWWISASVNVELNTMTVMVVDHGEGIAKTLPKSDNWGLIKAFLGGIADFLKNDSKIVAAAFQMGAGNQSQTGQPHRGKGLRENIKGYVDSHHSRGELLVVTNRAKYRFTKDGAREQTSADLVDLSFDGTFIQWTIQDYGDEQHHD